jgi:hypothetical protein
MRRAALATAAVALAVVGWAARPDPARDRRAELRAARLVEALTVTARPVPLDPARPDRVRVGELTYLYGADLDAAGAPRFGGLSGLKVSPEGSGLRVDAVSDEGDHVRFALPSDGVPARLTGTIGVLVDADGAPVQGKRSSDAESLTVGPAGELVGFERRHRILQYAPGFSGPARRAPSPPIGDLRENSGFEALAWVGALNALAVGSEDGRIWLCGEAAAGCRQVSGRGGPDGYNLTDLSELPGRPELVATYRAYDPVRGWRGLVAHVTLDGPNGTARKTVLARLPQRENFEGISAVGDGAGGWRLYLVADDNFSSRRRTLFLAFRWTPAPPAPAKEKGPASPPALSN